MNAIYIYDMSFVNGNYEIPENIRNHTNEYKIESKRNISISMYYLLGKKLKDIGLDLKDLYFINGKPCIDSINISLSHSKNYIAIMISNSICGVDVEELIDDKKDKLYEKICQNDLDSLNNSENKVLYATKRWTSLEAYYKAYGGSFMDLFNKDIKANSIELKGSVLSYIGDTDFTYLNDLLLEVSI